MNEMSYIVELNDSNMRQVMDNGLVLVQVSGTWCAPCQVLKPKIDQISSEFQNGLTVVHIDVDQHKEMVMEEMNVRNIPTLILFNDGVEVDRLVGGQIKKEDIVNIIEKQLN